MSKKVEKKKKLFKILKNDFFAFSQIDCLNLIKLILEEPSWNHINKYTLQSRKRDNNFLDRNHKE